MENKSLEEMIKELDQIATNLEDGNIKLDEAIENFERGVKVAKLCFEGLKQTAGKITVLKKEMEELIENPFKEEGN